MSPVSHQGNNKVVCQAFSGLLALRIVSLGDFPSPFRHTQCLAASLELDLLI